MDNQLSHKELQVLETFVISKNVPYLDVRMEIIDHFASAIEEIRKSEPQVTVQQGIDRVYSTFPITGFGLWMMEIENNLKKLFLANYFKNIASFLSIPKIVLTLFIFLGFYLFYSTVRPEISIWILPFVILLSQLYYYFTVKRKYRFQEGEKFKYIALQAYYDREWLFLLPMLVILWMYYVGWSSILSYSASNFFVFTMALVSTFILVIIHIVQFEMPKSLEHMLKKRYPLWDSFSLAKS